MVRFPLKSEILLLTDTGIIFLGTVIYAGHDSLTVSGLRKRIYNDQGSSEVDIAEKVVLDRNKIIGYSKLNEELEMEKFYGASQNKDKKTIVDLNKFRERH